MPAHCVPVPPVPFPEAQDAFIVLWGELATHHRTRFRQLSDEIRHYPTPIARCDEQLTKLIEERARARAALERMAAFELARSGGIASTRELEAFLDDTAPDDETDMAIRSRLKAMLDRDG
jgi:hypothetical protein